MKKFIILFILSTSFVMAKDLSISLSPESTTVEAGKTARVKVNFSQAPKKFSATDISIEGGTVDSVRKLSTRVYLAVVRASEDVKEVELQIQADAIRDNEGDLNESASNSVRIKVTLNTEKPVAEKPVAEKAGKTEQEKTDYNLKLSALLDAITASAKKNTTVSTTATTPTSGVSYYNCNGVAIPTTQQCVQQQTAAQQTVSYVQNSEPQYITVYDDYYDEYVTIPNPNYRATVQVVQQSVTPTTYFTGSYYTSTGSYFNNYARGVLRGITDYFDRSSDDDEDEEEW